jgi:hypothetical protein
MKASRKSRHPRHTHSIAFIFTKPRRSLNGGASCVPERLPLAGRLQPHSGPASMPPRLDGAFCDSFAACGTLCHLEPARRPPSPALCGATSRVTNQGTACPLAVPIRSQCPPDARGARASTPQHLRSSNRAPVRMSPCILPRSVSPPLAASSLVANPAVARSLPCSPPSSTRGLAMCDVLSRIVMRQQRRLPPSLRSPP